MLPKINMKKCSLALAHRPYALSYWRQQFPAGHVLLAHAEFRHISINVN